MKASKDLPELSKTELDIMKILWKGGRMSGREVHDHLNVIYNWAYSTTKTILDRMVVKGLLAKDNFHGVFLYQPLITRPMGLAQLVRNFADRVLEMDYVSVVSLFARSKTLTPAEIDELSKLLEEKN